MPALSEVRENTKKAWQLAKIQHWLQENMQNPKCLAVMGFFFFASLSRWFYLPSPFTLCCLLALISVDEKPYAALVGIGCGSIYQLLWGIDVPAWTVVSALAVPALSGIKWKREWHLSAVAVLLLLPGMVLSVMAEKYSIQEWLLNGLLLIMAWVLVPALKRAASCFFEKRTQNACADDVLCMVLPLLIVLSGMGKTTVWKINMGFAGASCFVLLSAHVLSGTAAMCAGFLSGIPFLLGGNGTYWCIVFSLSGLVCGMFQGRKKGACVILQVMIAALIGYLLQGQLILSPLVSSLCGGILFLVVPERWISKYSALIQNTSIAQKTDNPYLERRLGQLIQAIDGLAGAVPDAWMCQREKVDIAEEIAERLCENCDQMLVCWRDQYHERKKQFGEIADALQREDESFAVLSSCIQMEKLERIVQDMAEHERAQLMRMQQAEYEKEMLRTHFVALSQTMALRIEESMASSANCVYMERQIEDALRYLKYPASVKYVKRINEHYCVGLQKHPFSIVPDADKMLERHIGLKLNAPMHMIENKNGFIVFEEVAPLKIEHGTASACAVAPDRKNMSPYLAENGDATAWHVLHGGIAMTALSDGMGHGEGAGRESQKTLELLALCLNAGYSRAQALTAVNGMMLSATGGERFATVDLCMIDLWTGETCLNKLGASMSLVVQGQHIRAIEGAALPLGIIEHVKPMEHIMKLGKGDRVILLSDGITDVLSDENALASLIQRYMTISPQGMAEGILQEALLQVGGLPHDDMTVVCIGITEQQTQRHFN